MSTDIPNPNRFPIEARSYELDAYGHVNIAVYVNWLEHGRLCFLRDRGVTYQSAPEQHGVYLMVVQQNIGYRAQVRLGDRLDVVTSIERFGKSSFTFAARIEFEDGRLAAESQVTMVCVQADGRSAPMPEALRAQLEA